MRGSGRVKAGACGEDTPSRPDLNIAPTRAGYTSLGRMSLSRLRRLARGNLAAPLSESEKQGDEQSEGPDYGSDARVGSGEHREAGRSHDDARNAAR
jgi:hypothetical protein